MKKIEKLKLNKLSQDELNKSELNQLKGGLQCKCCCGYSGSGGVDTHTNYHANTIQGYMESFGENCMCGDGNVHYYGSW